MSVSFKYWDDCVDPEDMQALWMDADVRKEWLDAGEKMGQRIHLSRDPDGETYLTQTEMRAVAEIIVDRHFKSQLDVDMLRALAEIGSDRRLLAEGYDRKTKETRLGIMQVVPQTAEWLFREMGYRNYKIDGNQSLLFRPFINIYFAGAYIIWLSSHDGKERSEEYVVRAYKGGIKKATHKSTAQYFKQYLSVKQSLPPKSGQQMPANRSFATNSSLKAGDSWKYWDSIVSPEDMEELWRHPDVLKEWTASGERRGKVRFSQDPEKRPYLSRVEVKAVAEIIISRCFNSRGITPTALAAVAELCSMRFVHGVRAHTGLMGIDYPTASWLYKDIGYNTYKVSSVNDLYNPFASIYFGAAYLVWLSEYEGRRRSHQFIVQAYVGGPENVNLQETGPIWQKYQEILSSYEADKKGQGSCIIL
ncbi:uncharacterized protein LOC120262965 [Dioscorea cayenensis subsp. rotundata]|uniref:Uncharacterized protein LOC120262965 n=1 Tax=Dioscorea cayennensis subsp. rotundata TaxID=55577 RepID=A0AB40BHJ7_DIOCR|nr:uncharacterized protein LOC120262965 [Dioscorea cayenensis subsp. rotundata]